ncbi:hypothetical protein CWC05_20460, partial [Pseudoalteromonas ruthenica]
MVWALLIITLLLLLLIGRCVYKAHCHK